MRFREGQDKDRAQRLSDLVDSFVVQQRVEHHDGAADSRDRELDELGDLARQLSAIRFRPRSDIAASVFRDITTNGAGAPGAASAASWSWLRFGSHALRPAIAAALLVAAVVFGQGTVGSNAAFATEILTKSDLAVAGLVHPGQALFRRWRIIERIRDTAAAPERVVERYTHEWIDGADPRHATAKTFNARGEMYLAFANEPRGARYRPRVYYKAGFAEPYGLLSIAPGRHEFAAAAERFSGAARGIVDDYLARGYIYEPAVSEHRFNKAILDAARKPALPAAVLTVDTTGEFNGVPVFKLLAVEALRFPFRWLHDGPPRMWLERAETLKYIAKDSYLTLRSEETLEAEDGRRQFTVRELAESRVMAMDAAADSFRIDVPEGTVLREQSAYEHLLQVVRAAQRAPGFLAANATH